MKNGLLFFGLLVVLGVSGCESKPASVAAKEGPAVQADAEPAASAAPEDVAPAKPDHFYVMRDGLQYGYEPPVSDDDAKAGRVANALIMTKFLGEKEGAYQVMFSPQEGAIIIGECQKPCEFMKVMIFAGNMLVKKEIIRAENTLGGGMLSDAINGKLERFHNKVNGQDSYFWFTENGIKMLKS